MFWLIGTLVAIWVVFEVWGQSGKVRRMISPAGDETISFVNNWTAFQLRRSGWKEIQKERK